MTDSVHQSASSSRHDVGVFHTIDKYANTQAGGEKRAEQKETVRGLFPRQKKHKRDDHQQFGVHDDSLSP
jgi:hypothetical protein